MNGYIANLLCDSRVDLIGNIRIKTWKGEGSKASRM